MRLFLSQATLEEWALSDKADVRDGRLEVAGEAGAWEVCPAVHFVKLVSGADDRALVSKVKTQAQLAQLGAEHMMDAVVLGESAYEVVPGYVAEVQVLQGKAGDKRPQLSPEADMLAAFILNKLP